MKKINKLIFGVIFPSLMLVQPASSAQLEEIIVTAQKREQSMQSVPFSVSAISGQTLKDTGVFDIIDLQSVTPSLMTPSTGSPGQGASFRLRGFGSPPFQLGIEPAVATFVDGVYRSRSGVSVNDLVDISRIEVLKGPQGTLFGKNTTAGVVHVITNKPNPEDFDAFAEASVEKYDRTRLKGMVNVPLSDTSALRISGTFAEGDGWLENRGAGEDLNDLDRQNVRAQLMFQPREDLEINLAVNVSKIDETCCTTVRFADGPFTGPIGFLASLNGSTVISPANPEDLVTSINEQQRSEADDVLWSADINWQISDTMSLTSVTSIQDYELSTLVDGDFTGADLLVIDSEVELSAFTQELRLAGSTDTMDWAVGAFYSDEEIDRLRVFDWQSQIGIFFPPFLSPRPGIGVIDTLRQEGTSFSVFGHSSFKLSDALTLTTGLRFISEEKDGFGDFQQPNNIVLAFVNPSFRDSIDEDETTGTLSVQYDWSEGVMTYVTYSRGYKAGGINLAREGAGVFGLPTEATFDKETVDSFEVGAKMDLLEKRLRLNVALFQNEYNDLQNQIFLPPSFTVRNGEGAEIKGLEIETTLAATDYLTLNFGATLLDTSFDEGTDIGGGDIGGRDLPWAPDTSAAIGWSYARPLGENGMELLFSGNWLYRDGYFANSGSILGTEQGSSDIVNAQIGLRKGKWTGTIWCRNCGDERVSEVIFNSPVDFFPGLGAAVETYVNRPIEIGFTARYDF